MATSRFDASVRQDGDISVIDLRGDIDLEAEQALNDAYDRSAGRGTDLLLNFADVGYINSTGIALIVGLLAKARRDGRSMSAYGLSDHYRQIFEITRLADFMAIFPNEEAALSDDRSTAP
jgi:anti-sigma B factor antagonist